MKVGGNKEFLKGMLLAFTLALAGISYAQDDFEGSDVLTTEEIDIDGTFKRRGPSPAERMERQRKLLERNTTEKVNKRIEDERLKSERKLSKKLRKMLNGNNVGSDNFETSETHSTVSVKNQVSHEPELKQFKIKPSFGILNVKSDNVDYESQLGNHFSLSGESFISDRFAMGVGVTYSKLKINRINAFSNYNFLFNFSNINEEVEYSLFNVDLFGKFYFVKNSKVMPYGGLGLGYNRARVRYNDYTNLPYSVNYNYNFNALNFEPEFIDSFISAAVLIGADVSFTETIGLNFEMKFNRSLSDTENSSSTAQLVNRQEQQFLDDLGRDLGEATNISATLGLVVTF